MNKSPLLISALIIGLCSYTPAIAQQSSVIIKPRNGAPLPAYKRQAIGHMNAGRFKQAYDILKANLEANQGDIDTRFMLGQCAARLNQTEEALALYQGILADDPNLPRVRLELARAYMALGERDKAREAFEAVQASNPPPVVGENIQRFLDSIAAQRPWQARIALSYVVDSNVNSGPGDATALGPGTFTGVTGQHDHAWGVTGNFSHTHSLKSDMAWLSEISLFSLDYSTQNDSDQLILSGSTGPSWKLSNVVISLPLILEHVEVGHDYYNHSYGIAPQFRYPLNREYSIDGGLTFAKREHRNSSALRDGDAIGFNISLRKQLENGGFLQPTLRMGKENTQAAYFDTNSVGLSLGWFTKLPYDMSLYLQPSINRILRDAPDPIYIGCSGCGQSQADWQYQLTANLNKPLDKRGTNLSMGITLTRNDSNVAFTDYNRAQFTLMLSRRF